MTLLPGPDSPTHAPVLVDEVCRLVTPGPRVVDGTLGMGGHAEALRARGATIMGVDIDPEALRASQERLGTQQITYLHGRWFDPPILDTITKYQPHMVLLDMGVSSWQIDADHRGFTFRPGVVLDMRMDRTDPRPTAAAWLSSASLEELSDVFRAYGDERRSRQLAREILRRRANKLFETSDDLVNAIRAVLGPRSGPSDFARLFQAVRIAVNDELEGLERGLPYLRDALAPSGILAVISYHSGEDRIVKHTFREWGKTCRCPAEWPVCRCEGRAFGLVDPRRPLLPTPEEIANNPRARSAKLRVFRKHDEGEGPVLGDGLVAPLFGGGDRSGGAPARRP